MYAVRDTRTGEIVESGFAGREKAKILRDKLNKDHYGDNFEDYISKSQKLRFYVCRSKSHPRGESR